MYAMRPAFPSRPAWRHAFLLLAVPVATASAAGEARAQAQSQEGGDWQVMVGAGAIYTPDYEGSDDHDILPFPAISISYRDLFYVRGPELGVNLVRLKPSDDLKINIGPMARFRRDRPEDRNADLKGLGDVDLAIEVGGALAIEYGNAFLRVSGGKDVAGGHDGVVVEGEAGLRFNLAERLNASVSARTSWADRKYMSSYFSVSPTQSAASGLPVYRAEGGIKDVGAGLNLNYQLSRHWVISAIGGYSRLLNDAKDAPLVRLRGSDDQWTGGLFLAYRF